MKRMDNIENKEFKLKIVSICNSIYFNIRINKLWIMCV